MTPKKMRPSIPYGTLANFFLPNSIRELVQTGHSTYAGRIAQEYGLVESFGSNMPVGDFYDNIFKQLVQNYRNEYVYKNAIIEKILLEGSSLGALGILPEFRADDCKADIVTLDKTSHVYEIKSELDNFYRLDRQLNAYKKVFDLITVVTSEKLFKAVEERVPEDVGIMVLADKGYHFKEKNLHREPSSNRANVDPVIVLSSLQRSEYLKIIKEQFGISLKDLPNTQIYGVAKTWFQKLSPEIAHDCMVEALRKRRGTEYTDKLTVAVSNSLKAAFISMQMEQSERVQFVNIQYKAIGTVFI